MNMWKFAILAIFCGGLNSYVRLVFAQEDTALFGTQSVVFEPIGAGTSLVGCSLIYKAVTADASYNNGKPALVAGNIGITRTQAFTMLTLKIGFADLGSPNGRFAAPYFVHLQNTKSTTSKSPYSVFADRGGLRVSLALDDAASGIVQEMLETGKVTIVFNPRRGAADLLLPIDWTVSETAFVPPKQYNRKRSREALHQFGECYKEIQEHAGSGPPG
jgi:hypothetical protein